MNTAVNHAILATDASSSNARTGGIMKHILTTAAAAETAAFPVRARAVGGGVLVALAMAAGPGGASGTPQGAHGALSAQAAREPALPEVGETIDVRVVNVEAVVTDRRGHPVHGLTTSDFRLLVDGKEVPIDYFTEIRAGAGVAAPGAGPSAAAAPVPPGATVGRSYLVFVDDGLAVGKPRDAALESLRRSLPLLRPEDRMAVVAFDGNALALLSGWTVDQDALAAALRRAETLPPRGNQVLAQAHTMEDDLDLVMSVPSDGDGPLQVSAVVGAQLRRLPSPEAVSQAHKSMSAAAAALRGLELPPGRRSMLLLSAAWTLGSAAAYYGPLVVTANQLGYTLYPVDVAASNASWLGAFEQLARATGGSALSGTETAAMNRIADDLGSYYWLGFTPAARSAVDLQHRIQVRVRQPDLTVRARDSYADVSRATLATMKAENLLFFGAAQDVPGAGTATPRRLRIEAGRPRRAGIGRMAVPLTVYVPTAALAFTPADGGFVAAATLAVAVLDRKGGLADLATPLRLTVAARPATGGTMRFTTNLELRRLRQRLVVSLPDAQGSDILTGEIEIQPPG
jgi:VWFA-related protein